VHGFEEAPQRRYWTKVEALVRRDHHHPPMLDGRVKLQKAIGLGGEAVVETGIGAD
jgi:hypothetical protein